MPAREMRMEMFLRALMRGDFNKARSHLEKLEKMVGNGEWGRGYSKAINGFISALKDNDSDALIVQLVKDIDYERAKQLLKHFEEILKHEFRDDFEKGYYTAWIEFLRAYLGVENAKKRRVDEKA